MNIYKIVYLLTRRTTGSVSAKIIRIKASNEAVALSVFAAIVFQKYVVEVLSVTDEGPDVIASPSSSPSLSISASPSNSDNTFTDLPGFNEWLAAAEDNAPMHYNSGDMDYDGTIGWYNLSDLSGNDYATQARQWASMSVTYWGNQGYTVQGWRNYSTGLYRRWQREGMTQNHFEALELFRNNGGYSNPGQNDWLSPPDDVWNIWNYNCIRETAYALLHYVNGETMREEAGVIPVRETHMDAVQGIPYRRMERLVEASVGHWEVLGQLDRDMKPFMMALSSFALIKAFDWDPAMVLDYTMGVDLVNLIKPIWDAILPEIIVDNGGHMGTIYKYLPTGGVDGFPQEGHPITGVPGGATGSIVNDLNILVATPIAWIYNETGDQQYRTWFDQLVDGSTHLAWWSTPNHKQYFQQLMTAKEAFTWRLG